MEPEEIKELRKDLDISQSEFASLFDVHPMTVSKWERGVLEPSGYQTALMEKFQKAINKKDLKKSRFPGGISGLIAGTGVVSALFFLLKAAFDEDKED